MENKITARSMLKDIWAMRKFALQLTGRGRAYDTLLKHILKDDYYYDEDIRYPILKEIQSELGLSYSVVRNQIQEIYSDLEDVYNNEVDYTIKDVDYIFFLSFLNNTAQVKLQNIPVPPRVGEEVILPYFKEKLHAESFYVRSIQHEFTDSKQIVFVKLVVGHYNQYWNLFRDEEFAKGRMSYDEYHSSEESDIRRKYNLRWL